MQKVVTPMLLGVTLLIFLSYAFTATIPLYRKSNPAEIKELDVPHATYHTAQLLGSLAGMGEYFTQIQVGTPPQNFSVQVDTGSVALAIPSTGCKLWKDPQTPTSKPCAHADAFYDPSASSTSAYIGCNQTRLCRYCSHRNSYCAFTLGYADGSFLAGDQRSDQVSMGGLLPAEVVFGVIAIESEGFGRTDLDGIMVIKSIPSVSHFTFRDLGIKL